MTPNEPDNVQIPIMAQKLKWAKRPLGGEYYYIGEQNPLSPALEPYGWRKHANDTIV